MSQSKVCVYTDGACSRNPGPGGWAFIVLRDGEVYVSRSGAEEKTTNNRMELLAAIEALSFVKAEEALNEGTISVYTDSQYVQRGASEWMLLWKERHWRNSDRMPVKNKDLWEKLDELAQGMSIEWFWVRGHAGNEYNEMADSLTKEAVAALEGKLEGAKSAT